MIQFDEVFLAFLGHPLFEDVSFSIQKGEKCGLIGRNGSGKSTILRLLDGEMQPDKGTITVPKNYKLGFLQQHIKFTQNTLLEEALLALPPQEKDHVYKAEKILFGLGFTDKDLQMPPNTFSGGFHLRLHLAKVLISEPDCLLLDEPANYLDILSLRWLTQFLRKWQGEFILVSHDRDFMDNLTTHTIGIHRQKVRKMKGSSIAFFQQILLEEEVHEKTRLKQDKKKERVEQFVERFGAKATKATQARSKMKLLAKEPVLEKLNALLSLSFAFQEAPFAGKKLLEAKNLSFSYTEAPLIRNFSLEVQKGERIAIIGKNGRGKSTLLRLLGGDLLPKVGEVIPAGQLNIGYFGQTHVSRLQNDHTIEQEIALGGGDLSYSDVKAIAGLMLFSGPLSEKKIGTLSGGEKSRVLLGKILAKPCNLLLLDEPTHHLDIESIEALIDALEAFSGAIIIVTHSELILRRLGFDTLILCNESTQTAISYDYDTFLEKIGWEEEKKGKEIKESSKNNRRERAEWVAARSAALKPVQTQINSCEKELAALEAEQKKDQTLLETGEVAPIFLKTFGLRQKQIEDLEAKLYELYELFEKTKIEFEKTSTDL